MAALHAAKSGKEVLLLEKDPDIGLPVRCAEGVSAEALERIIPVQKRWIAREIIGARLIAPDGTCVELSGTGRGYVLHRKIFDADLAALAAGEGARILTRAYVYGLMRDGKRVSGVKARIMGNDTEIRAGVVIAADGIESRVGRWAGLSTHVLPEDMDTCVQMTLTNIDMNSDWVELYFGNQIAPGGYLWIFPKGERSANVGLGISGNHARSGGPMEYLQAFVRRRFPDASVLHCVAGGVPTAPPLKKLTTDGLMVVGDAARQINPLTGGGILYAMAAGRIAGLEAAAALDRGDVSARSLNTYAQEWNRSHGKNNRRCYRIKKVVNRFSDDELNGIAGAALKVPVAERSVFRILKAALLNHPQLIVEAARVFT
jgi:digeranylgeranylglycerophospholipid reductase